MANFVRFQMYSERPLMITGDDSSIAKELTSYTVESITVEGEPCVFFDSPHYGGKFVVYRAGEAERFPLELNTIKSLRRIKGGINRSQVTLYPHPFFSGKDESFQSDTPQIQGKYLSLKVDEGAVIFFDDENYTGEKRILLKGDEVQNFTAMNLTSIGKSMRTAWDMVQQ